MMIHLNLVKCFSAIILLKKIYIAEKKWEKINKSEESIVWGFFLCVCTYNTGISKKSSNQWEVNANQNSAGKLF